ARLIDELGQYPEALRLFRRAIEIKLAQKVRIGHDMLRYSRALANFTKIDVHRTPNEVLSHYEDLAHLADRYFTEQPHPFGYERLEYHLNRRDLTTVEPFTLNDVK